jgi:hypothetical protein
VRRSWLRARPVFAAAVVAALTATGGAAWALWRITGSGGSAMVAGSAVELRLTARPRPDVPLYPGAKTDLKVTVRNDNPFPVLVTSVRPGSGAVTVDGPHAATGCHTTGVSLTRSAFSVTWSIPARSSREFLLSKAVQMTNASDSACQGGAFSVPLSASGRSDA